MEVLDPRPFGLLRMVAGFRHRVTPSTYAMVGFVLMLFKYTIEGAVISYTTGIYYSFWHFVVPSVAMREPFFEAASWLGWATAVWSLPFLWVAVSMTFRRCIDAGINPWCSLLVLIPLINLLVMLLLVFLPSRQANRMDAALQTGSPLNDPEIQNDIKNNSEFQIQTVPQVDEPRDPKRVFAAAMAGAAAGGLFAVLLTAISVYAIQSYGAALFFGMPVVAGAIGSYVYNQPRIRDLGGSMLVGFLTTLLAGLFLIMFAMEGAICLVMAAPIICPVGALGGLLGWSIAKIVVVDNRYMAGGIVLMLPLLGILEHRNTTTPTYSVETEVIINAPAEMVWQNVIAFPEIESPPAWYFNLGVACPLRARIEGNGVGAIRHCEFTTGSFVEPITKWQAPTHLAFDVTEQPDPLTELTPYRHIHPPHLEGSFKSVKGEFRLVAMDDNTTKLIGRTWYQLDMGPRVYWKRWSDEIVHRIHTRVLEHIKTISENPSGK